jgi:hypothetical protein
MKQKTLQMASRAVGGARKLRDVLDVPTADIMAWLNGEAEPPDPVFLKALAVVLDAIEKGKLPRTD